MKTAERLTRWLASRGTCGTDKEQDMRSGVMRAAAGVAVAGVVVCALGGCFTHATYAPAPARSVAGEWVVDLSPQRDGSYTKELVIVPDEPAESSTTFTGLVYDGTPIKGRMRKGPPVPFFEFESDEQGEKGGPYRWSGSLNRKNGKLEGSVSSSARGLDMFWTATRK